MGVICHSLWGVICHFVKRLYVIRHFVICHFVICRIVICRIVICRIVICRLVICRFVICRFVICHLLLRVVGTAKSGAQKIEEKNLEALDFSKVTLHQAKRLEMDSQVRTWMIG